MTRTLMIFRNEMDRDYDRFIFGPEGMSMAIADGVAKAVALKCGYGAWEDIETELVKLGFQAVDSWHHSEVAL